MQRMVTLTVNTTIAAAAAAASHRSMTSLSAENRLAAFEGHRK